jgi:hypothetical protein
MEPRHQSLQRIWDEWHGLGSRYSNKLVAGGMVALEAKHHAKWRSHLDGHEVSRMKCVLIGFGAYMEENKGVGLETAIADLQPIFDDEGRSVVKLVTRMHKERWLGKKASQGAKKKAPNSAQVTTL